ncbi:MAG TPA: phospho-N-acetylmuramoyl-pentapeptide-transferase [Candidatus Krumholzibacteria bacterium]|nr:phospho-N-acetylmuramoyl-pentapeptide-transferase [Candidatus Krumholzibacteria bacterium]
MFHVFVEQLVDLWSPFNVFRYITFRSAYATLTALLICFFFGNWTIRMLREKQIGESIREEGPEHHRSKAGTPTMGGLLIVAAIVIPVLLWGDLRSQPVIMALAATLYMGLLGFLDDYFKLRRHKSGLSGRWKLLFQALFGLVVGYWIMRQPEFGPMATKTTVPFLAEITLDWGWLYLPLAVLVFSGTTNAVNLADGLDGLAVGLCLFCFIAYAGLGYVTGNAVFADYLRIPFIPGVGELAVFATATVGACLGFLWYNSHPAQVFMGDTGSMALGGALASLALLTKHELLLVIVGGVFVAEAASTFIQVVSYKMRGKRVFKMAPLHHHFELLGWSETKVVIRFWIVGAMLALLTISTLKIR